MAQLCSTRQNSAKYPGDDLIAELVAFLPAAMLGVVSTCSRGTLMASEACWRTHLVEIDRLPSWQGRTCRGEWQRSIEVDGFAMGAARREYGLCLRGLRDAVRSVCSEPPTSEQVLQFVARVRSHHSWYKHLPIERGTFFQFAMSPTAGMRFCPDGIKEYVRGDGTEFHYTWRATSEYRKRFHCFVWRETDEEKSQLQDCTVESLDSKPLLLPAMSSSYIPVTACVYPHSPGYNLLESVYRKYKEFRNQESFDLKDLGSFASRWTRHRTGCGLPYEVLADFDKLYEFEKQHPGNTWDQRSGALLEDAHSLCRALFPHYTADDLQLEVDELLSSGSARAEGPSGSAKRAEGARAQVRMIHALLDWVRFIWGNDAVPSVCLSMPASERQELRSSQRQLQRRSTGGSLI